MKALRASTSERLKPIRFSVGFRESGIEPNRGRRLLPVGKNRDWCRCLWLRLDFRGRTGRIPAAALNRPAAQRLLGEALIRRGEIRYEPHALQVLTDDDEIELAYYIFDDHYLGEHPGRAAYLLHRDWKLPTTTGDKPGKLSVATKQVQPSAGLRRNLSCVPR